jgi:hypothetical protein
LRRLLLALAIQAVVILAYAWGGAIWAKRHTGQSVLFAPATGTDAYIHWLIDVPALVAPIVPIGVGAITCVMVALNRWRARFLFILIACFAAWFVTMLGLVFLAIDIDP